MKNEFSNSAYQHTLPAIDYDQYYRTGVANKGEPEISPPIVFLHDMNALFDDEEKGIPLPWTKKFRVRRKEVTVVSGINGHGKSNVMGQIITHLCGYGEICCNLSMEMPPGRTLMRQCKQAVGNENPTLDYRERFIHWMQGKYYLSDFKRPMSRYGVLGALLWSARERGCTQIVVDSLMKCGIPHDDFTGQGWFVNELCELAKELDIHVWLIAHGRKRDDELKPMDKFDIAGHADITNLPDNVLTVFRNKRKERAVQAGEKMMDGKLIEEKADALIRCDKNRHGDWEGTVPLSFHAASGQYIPHQAREIYTKLKRTLDGMQGFGAAA